MFLYVEIVSDNDFMIIVPNSRWRLLNRKWVKPGLYITYKYYYNVFIYVFIGGPYVEIAFGNDFMIIVLIQDGGY